MIVAIDNLRICAYCGKDKPLTKEHVIPDWWCGKFGSSNVTSYLERSPKKIIGNAATKKDVCSDCNNGALSALDSYGKELFEKYFSKFIYAGETSEFSYDYQGLVKWLLKCSYNSARVHNADLEILEGYKSYLITNKPLPDDLIIYCSTTAPTLVHENSIFKLAARQDKNNAKEFEIFRIGVFRLPDFDTIDWCFRSVIINSYVFSMCVPKLSANFSKTKRELTNVALKTKFMGIKLPKTGQVTLPPPFMDSYSFFNVHMRSNPLAYGFFTDDIAKSIQQGDRESVIVYPIQREDIELGNTEDIERFFYYITHCREIALAYMERIEFVVDGYNHDLRELHEIEEVVIYLSKLNKVFPYWIFFQSEEGIWINALLACLTQKASNQNMVELDSKRISRFINNWFLGLNELCHRCGIGEMLNKKISKDFSDRLHKILSTSQIT